MAKGKNKQLSKKGKIAKKGDRHPFTKKEWFQVMAPPALKQVKQVGWTVCKKPVGTQVVSDFLKNRVAEISFADVTNQAKDVNKKVQIHFDEISGNACQTSFYKYELVREKISAMLKKRQTLIEVIAEVKTLEGVSLRVMVVAVSRKRSAQRKLNSYAQSSKVRLFRKTLTAELQKLASKKSANDFANEIITETINKGLEEVGQKVIPNIQLQVTKLKISKKNTVEIRAVADSTPVNTQNDKAIKENDKAKVTL